MRRIGPTIIVDKLNINPETVLAIVKKFLQKKYEEQHYDGIILGLSGGLDSAVLVSIAAKLIDATKVHALHLFDRDSQPRFLEYATNLANTLHIQFEVRDITNLVDGLVTQRRMAIRTNRVFRRLRITSVTRYFSRRIYYYTQKNYPLFTLLRRFGIVIPSPIQRLYGKAIQPTRIGFGPKHIIRRHVLEEYAAERNLLLVGAANRSEALIGWFVEGGVDDLPIEPIMGLYKHQVYQLGKFLNLPSEIIEEPPSPDFMAGMTDELMIGLPWDKIDKVLYVLENNLDKSLALDNGITSVEFDKVLWRYENAQKKQGNLHEYPTIEESY